jgi:hypothetical protein
LLRRNSTYAAALLALTLLSTGCSTFPRDFDRAASAPPKSVDTFAITGPWQGEWKSNGGHQGGLRCLLTAVPSSALPGSLGEAAANPPRREYEARFEAKFWGIFTAHYAVRLTGTAAFDGTVTLSGDHDLGSLVGGVFHYDATVTPQRFDATYKSRDDAGVFRMTRPNR